MATHCTRDHIHGCVFGAALGDTLGAPHESVGRQAGLSLARYTGQIRHPITRQSRFHGKRISEVGMVTDDTEMGMALAYSIINKRGYDPDEAVIEYMKWGASKPPFAGHNTRALLFGIKTLKGYKRRHERYCANTPVGSRSQSNGCLMRAFPLVALGGDAPDAARLDSALTNPNPTCIESVAAYSECLAQLAVGKPPTEAVALALEECGDAEVKGVIRAAFEGSDPRNVAEPGKYGWVLHGMWCAFRALRMAEMSREFGSTVDWVVRLGGDTDTNACIAGAMVGAYLGLVALKVEPVTLANIGLVLRCETTGGEKMERPPEYRGRNLVGLAKELGRLASP